MEEMKKRKTKFIRCEQNRMYKIKSILNHCFYAQIK